MPKDKFRQKLQDHKTLTERRAYNLIQKLVGGKFVVRTNHPISVYVHGKFQTYYLDLYIRGIRLGIELDGGIHKTRVDKDLERDFAIMSQTRSMLIRFKNEEVLGTDGSYFLDTVRQAIISRAEVLLEKKEWEILESFMRRWYKLHQKIKWIDLPGWVSKFTTELKTV